MGFPLLPILKTIPTIVGALQQISSSLSARRAAGAAGRMEDRTARLEEDLLKASTAVAELARQVEALAEALRTQQAEQAALVQRLRVVTGVALGALVAAIGGVIAAVAQ